jgi:acyl carrier protein
MSAQVWEQLREFILTSYLFGDADRMPADSDSLLQTGVLDSTGVLEMIEFLESEFAISVEDHETVPANLDSISGLVDFVAAKRSVGAGAA